MRKKLLEWEKGYIIKIIAYLLLLTIELKWINIAFFFLLLIGGILIYNKLKNSKNKQIQEFFMNWEVMVVPYVVLIFYSLSYL